MPCVRAYGAARAVARLATATSSPPALAPMARTRRTVIRPVPRMPHRTSGGVATASAGPTRARHVERDRADDDHALDDLLPERVDADERQPVADDAEHEHAGHDAADPPDAARGRDAAHHTGGDRIELVQLPVPARGAPRARGLEPAGHAVAGTSDRIDRDERPDDVHARHLRRLRVAADRIDVLAEDRLLQQHPEDDRGRPGDGDDERDRQAADAELAGAQVR